MGNVLVSSVNTRAARRLVDRFASGGSDPRRVVESAADCNRHILRYSCVTVDVGSIGPDNEQPAHVPLAWKTWRPDLEKAHAARVWPSTSRLPSDSCVCRMFFCCCHFALFNMFEMSL